MKNLNPLLMIDGYKTDHRRQYPDGTQFVYSNMTPRKSRMPGVDHVVVFGIQYFIKEYLVNRFNDCFFDRDKDEVVGEYERCMDEYLGKGAVPVDHIADLHDLGYLPLHIKALPEGTLCPMRVPMLTIVNTAEDFFWLTNQLETILSSTIWGACTSATIAYEYRKQFDRWNKATGVPVEFSKFQGHDFSFRGMSSAESAAISGAAHLTSFVGTDTVPAIEFLKRYYAAESSGLIGCSVPATEHSCMCMGGVDAEIDTYRRLINWVYPTGIVSIVSDTWDFWSIVTDGVTALKGDILSRDGKVVIRPDSGDPVKVICGDPDAPEGSPENIGAVRCLWNVFGGSVTATGHKQLDPHVGLIYGDSITLERQKAILSGLAEIGFCSSVVLGIGSYSYQYNTRDTFGFAVKATWGVVNDSPREIFKSPKTDRSGEKKSATGLLCVTNGEDGELRLLDRCSDIAETEGQLKTVFLNSAICPTQSLNEIRRRLHGASF